MILKGSNIMEIVNMIRQRKIKREGSQSITEDIEYDAEAPHIQLSKEIILILQKPTPMNTSEIDGMTNYSTYFHLPPSSHVQKVNELFQKSWVKPIDDDGKKFLGKRVHFVMSIQNPNLKQRYKEYCTKIRMKGNVLNERILWHGTSMLCENDMLGQCRKSKCSLCNICSNGFEIQKNSHQR
jgi:hypothetical protein